MNKVPLLLLVFSAAVSSQNPSGAQSPCVAQPTSMMQMRQCADYEYKQSDQRLTKVYDKAMQYMNDDLGRAKKKRDQDQVKYEQAVIDALSEAQRAWLTYREVQCKAAAQMYEPGTMAPLAYSNCLKTLTDHRIGDLKSVYEEGDEKLE